MRHRWRLAGVLMLASLLASLGTLTFGATVPAPAGASPSASGPFTSLTPTRILDTRIGTGAPAAPVAAGGTVALQVEGAAGVPATGVSAVVLNVTVTQPSAQGHITVYPDGSALPTASNLNFLPGKTVPNLVIAPVGSDGKVDLNNGSTGTVQLVADVSGYFSGGGTPANGAFTPLTPDRLLDTRNGTGAPEGAVASEGTVALSVEGAGGIPATGVSAVVLNVTATQPSAQGHITVYPDGTTLPTASNLNFSAGETVPNLVIAPVGADGKVDLNDGSVGSVQLVADVSGYFEGTPPNLDQSSSDAAGAVGGAADVSPHTSTPAAVPSDTAITLQIAGIGGVPATGVSAVAMNVTVTAPTAPAGHITVYPDGTTLPTASNLNFTAGETVPNLVITPVGSDGEVDLYNGSVGTVELVADVSGYFLGSGSDSGSLEPMAPVRFLDTRIGTGEGSSTAPPSPGAISGTVTGTGSAPVAGVTVDAFSGSVRVGSATTAADGTYQVGNLPAGTYDVCFDASTVSSGAPATGYADACDNNVAWDGLGSDISGATGVAVTSGTATTGINAALLAGGAIAGTVSDSNTGPISGVAAEVYTTSGNYLKTATTAGDGTYEVTGLTTGSYDVCFNGSGAGESDQCYSGVSWSGVASDIGAANAVSTADGSVTGSIDASLSSGGAISGTVTDAHSDPLADVEAEVFSSSEQEVGFAYTTSNGTYTVTGLPAESVHVCFNAGGATGGTSTTGYPAQCYNGVAWDGSAADSENATAIAIVAGTTKTGINATLAAGGAISGRVTDSSSDGLANVTVDVDSTGSGGFEATAITDSNGDYTVDGLPAGTQTICFNAGGATGGSSTGGYLDQCYDNVSWNGYENEVLAGATGVSVAASATTTGINATLTSGGSISGTVTDLTSDPLSDVDVEVFTSNDEYVSGAFTSPSGTYSVSGLATGIYDVCFWTAEVVGGGSSTGYLDQCYNNVSWDGNEFDASGANPVPVTAGSNTGSINAALGSASGTISGTVTDASSDPLSGVDVEVINTTNSDVVANATTSSNGTYSASGLAPGIYDVCFSGSFISGGSSTTGYADQCYSGAPWVGYSYETSGATTVQVTAGSSTSSINATLVAGGQVSGTVDDASSDPLADVQVELVNSSGSEVSSTVTGSDGTYTLTGISPGTYDVCFAVSTFYEPTGGTSNTGYLDQCYDGGTWNGDPNDISGATALQVTAGSTATEIDGALLTGGAISGTVDDAGSNALNDVEVEVLTASGQDSVEIDSSYTEPNGSFSIIGLPSGTYDVCFVPSEATGGSSTTGYLDQCYNDVSWDGDTFDIPGTNTVQVTAGSTVTGVDGALAAAGGISGTVTDSSSLPLDNVGVEVLFPGGGEVASVETGSSGTYSVSGLTPGSYDVCFTGAAATGGATNTGYFDQCYNDVSWSGSNYSLGGVTSIQVTSGSVATDINGTLAAAGGISGTVDDASSHPLDGVEVSVLTTAGSSVQSTETNSSGTYSVTGLSAGTYEVCFSSTTYASPTGGSSTTGYLDQCYHDVTWDGSFSDVTGATSVTVTDGTSASGVNAALASAGGISGTVDDTSAHPLDGVEVEVLNSSGIEVAYQQTASNGTYAVTGLSTGTYDVCFTGSSATGGSSNTAYLDQCYSGVDWDGSTADVSGATAVHVTAGSGATGVNGALDPAGGISGTVDDAKSHPLDDVAVVVFSSTGIEIGSAETGGNGTYTVTGLATGTYDVCFSVSTYEEPTGGISTTGYLDQCYNDVSWNGSESDFVGTTTVHVTAGSTASGINDALATAGAISGTVDDASSHPLEDAEVQLFSSGGSFLGGTFTGASGTYEFPGLSTGSYNVCFYGSDVATGGSSTTGYLSQCYSGVSWAGGETDASGATAVHVTAGSTASNVNAALAAAAAISGTVDDSSSHPLGGISVEVFTTAGVAENSAVTASDGTYSVTGLSTGTYDVCFETTSYEVTTGGASTTGYGAQCDNGVSWDGSPSDISGATAVHVTAGSTAGGVNAALPNGGVVSGTVDDASAHPLANVEVEVLTTTGYEVASAATASDGTYAISNLSAGSYDVCFDAYDGGSSTTGYGEQCYNDVTWDGSNSDLSGVTSVHVTAGATTSGINAALPNGGAISGTVDDASSHPLEEVSVEVLTASGKLVNSAYTGADGTYTIVGLSAGTYDVCFGAFNGGSSATGYGEQCYNDVTWDGATSDLTGASGVHVTAGETTSGVNAALPNGGVISGAVDDTSSHPLSGVQIEVVTASGSEVGYGVSGGHGTYSIDGLSAGTYEVCFDASEADGGTSTSGYLDQCYSNVSWDGNIADVSGATAVHVTAGATSTANADLTSG